MIKKIIIYVLCLSVLFSQFSIAEEKFLSLKKSKEKYIKKKIVAEKVKK